MTVSFLTILRRSGLVIVLGLSLTLVLVGTLHSGIAVTYAQCGTGIIRVAATGMDTSGCGCAATPCRTIQYAVNQASSGDEVRIAAGVYTGVSHIPSLDTSTFTATQIAVILKSLTLRGGYTTTNWTAFNPVANPTTLDAQGQGRVFYVTGPVSATIEGLHITGGNAAGLGGPFNDSGGGVIIMGVDAHTITLKNNWIFSNGVFSVSESYGGGVEIFASTVELDNNQIYSNTVRNGGGLDIVSSVAVFNGNRLFGNTAEQGGGVTLFQSDATFSRNTFNGNTAVNANQSGVGGGIITLESTATFNGNRVVANSANDGGGAFLYDSNITFTNNIIAENGGYPRPAGVAVLSSTVRMLHSTIVFNDRENGMGVYVSNDGAPAMQSYVIMSNSIVAAQGAGVYNPGGGVVTMTATLWGTYTWRNIYADWMTDGGGEITTSLNYWGDPGFVDGFSGEYHLSGVSEAINRGINAGVAEDIDGERRPFGRAPDLGADEWHADGLSIVKTGPSAVAVGTPISYTLTLTNNGYWTLNNVVITDEIPFGANYVSGGIRTGNIVNWTLSSLNVGNIGQVTFVVTASEVITNEYYEFSADNLKQVPGNDIVVTLVDTIPVSGLSAVNSSPTPLGQTTVLTANVTEGSHVFYTWDLGDGVITRTQNPGILHRYQGVGNYTAAVTAANAINSITATTRITITDAPILSIVKTAPAMALAGDPVTFTLFVTNSGTLTANNLVITDALPANAHYVSGGINIGNVISWTASSLAPNAVLSKTCVVTTALPILNEYYRVWDDSGISSAGSKAIYVDIMPFKVTRVVPPGNRASVAPGTPISATFTHFIDNNTISARTFSVQGQQTGVYTGNYWAADKSAQFNAAGNFKPGERVTVILSDDFKAANGVSLNPYIWQFRARAGSGSGVYVDTGQRIAISDTRGIALGDLDGDGDLDAFIVNAGSGSSLQPNEVWLNDGTGVFTDTGQRLGHSESRGVALGDFDGDGDLDAFVANLSDLNGNRTDKVWLNDGSGNFTDSGQPFGNSGSYNVALGDLDGDGNLDAFVSSTGANLVWLGDGRGNFSDSGQRLGDSGSTTVSLGDLDNDGDLDAFISNIYPGTYPHFRPNTVWFNNGDGIFTDSGQRLGASYSMCVDLGDVDGDGDLDAFVSNGFYQSNSVWLNDGAGYFMRANQVLGDTDSAWVDLGDVDGDGDLDALVANALARAGGRLWLNEGQGLFVNSQRLGSTGGFVAVFGDLDDDGDLDAFVENEGTSNRIWKNENQVNLEISKNVISTNTAPPDAPVTYTLVYTNYGPSLATNVLITDIIPLSLTNISYTAGGATITPTGSVSYVWQVADLLPGEGGVITVSGVMSSSLPDGASFTNTAVITSVVIERDAVNNRTQAVVTVRWPRVGFSSNVYSVTEDAGIATITVLLDAAPHKRVSVQYRTADNVALAGSDYISRSGVLTFTPGITLQSFTVPIVNDALDEYDEPLLLYLSNAQGVILSTPTTATLSIVDNDPPPVVNFSKLIYSVSEDAGAATITVTLDSVSSLTASVGYSTGDDTAFAGSDYISRSGVLTFTPGITLQSFTLSITNDLVAEGNESLTLTLRYPDNATLGVANTAALIISDDDAAGVIITPTLIAVSESGLTDVYQIALTSQPMAPVTITVHTGAQLNSIPAMAFAPLEWMTPQSVTVGAVDDDAVEGLRVSIISHTISSADVNYNAAAVFSVTVVITDNDVATTADLSVTKTVALSSATVGNPLTYTITVANSGPDPAAGVILTDTLPAGVEFISASAGCSGMNLVLCHLGDLPKDAVSIVSIVVTPTVTGTLINTAAVTSDVDDPVSANNTDSVEVSVNPHLEGKPDKIYLPIVLKE